MVADSREQYKDAVDCLDGESIEHRYRIGNILRRLAILEEVALQQDRTLGLPSPKKRAKRSNSGMLPEEKETTLTTCTVYILAQHNKL